MTVTLTLTDDELEKVRAAVWEQKLQIEQLWPSVERLKHSAAWSEPGVQDIVNSTERSITTYRSLQQKLNDVSKSERMF